MLQRLDVPYLDSSAAQLVWRLGAPEQPALARRSVERAPWTVELRLLGASHQVLVHSDGGVRCSELVACRPGQPGHLPATVLEESEGLRYRFRSTVDALPREDLGARAEALVTRLQGRDDALVGTFPGSPHAVTAIEVTAGGWRTWHVYPQTGEVVETVTDFGARA